MGTPSFVGACGEYVGVLAERHEVDKLEEQRLSIKTTDLAGHLGAGDLFLTR